MVEPPATQYSEKLGDPQNHWFQSTKWCSVVMYNLGNPIIFGNLQIIIKRKLLDMASAYFKKPRVNMCQHESCKYITFKVCNWSRTRQVALPIQGLEYKIVQLAEGARLWGYYPKGTPKDRGLLLVEPTSNTDQCCYSFLKTTTCRPIFVANLIFAGQNESTLGTPK